MLIQVLGAGCPRCDALLENVRRAVADSGLDAQIEAIREPARIMAFEVLLLPGLLIDGEVKAVGRVPGAEEIGAWIAAKDEG